jgi:hypothetical protein
MVMGILTVLGLSACLNPIGFDPDFRLTVDANVEGEISVVSPDAALILQNHTRTLDITHVEVRDSEYSSIVAYIAGKPRAGFEKVFNLRPKTDKEYEIFLWYTETDPKYNAAGAPPGPNSITNAGWDWGGKPYPNDTAAVSVRADKRLNIALPKKGLYYLHFFRRADGTIGVTLNPGEYEDTKNNGDNQDTKVDPEDSPDEGQTDGGLNGNNRDKVGLLVFKNLTGIPTNYIDFDFFQNINGADQTIKHYSMVPGPKARDQRSILLGPHDWTTQVDYTVNGTAHKTMPKTVTVATGNIFYAYFYKTKFGYAVSTHWPPLVGPNDPEAPDDGNANPDDIVGDGEGILEITNKAVSGKVIEQIRLDGVPQTVNMAFDDVRRWVLPVGTHTVAFKPRNQAVFGFTLDREIKSKQVTKLSYVDALGDIDVIPPDDLGYGTGLIKVINNSTGVVVAVNVIDLENLSGPTMGIHWTEFVPPYTIGYNKSGNVPVIGDSDFQIESGPHYLVQVSVETTSGAVDIERLLDIKDKINEIVISQNEVENGKRNGSKVNVINSTTTPSTILGMSIYDPLEPSKLMNISLNVVNGGSQYVYALSSSAFPILNGKTYVAKLTVYGNGNIGTVNKTFSPDGTLYSISPDTHLRTVTLVQSDIEGHVPPLVPEFHQVNSLTLANSTVTSVIPNQFSPDPPQYGSLNLNNVAVINPANATVQDITWSLESGGTAPGGIYNFNPGTGQLNVSGGDLSNHGQTVKVKATMVNAQGTILSKTDYVTTFTITLAYQETAIVPQPVNSITTNGSPVSIYVGETHDLTQTVVINPPNAQIGGVPITANNLVWASAVGSGAGTVNGKIFTATKAGTVTVEGTLTASANNGTQRTVTITITILPKPVRTLRILHTPKNTDSVKGVVLVPTDINPALFGPNSLGGSYPSAGIDVCDFGNGKGFATCRGQDPVMTGHSGLRFATTNNSSFYTNTSASGFQKLFPQNFSGTLNAYAGSATYSYTTGGRKILYVGFSKAIKYGTAYTYADVEVDSGAYFVFFLEGDNRIRGYTHTGWYNPDYKRDYYFYVDTASHADEYYVGAAKQPTSVAGGSYVIPVLYNSHANYANISTPTLTHSDGK